MREHGENRIGSKSPGTPGLTLAYATVIFLCAGCSSSTLTLPPNSDIDQVYRVSSRQLPPEPVYNRLRWVHLPEVVPARDTARSSGPMLKPVFEFSVSNTPLQQVAKILASTGRYDSYCAASIADIKLTLKRLGTIDELAEAIEHEAGIRVVVDHDNREVRFLAQQAETARFFDR